MAKYGYTNSTDAGSPYLASRGAEQIWQSMNMPQVPNVRLEVERSPDEVQYIWQDDAACLFSPPELFEYEVDRDYSEARKDCNKCPVWHLCYQTAEPEDFQWTMRAGVEPWGNSAPPLKAEPREYVREREVVSRGKECQKGHDQWVARGDGNYRCKPCQKANNLKQNEKRKGERTGPTRTREGFSRGKQCQYGHDSWFVRNKAGEFECLPCNLERNRKAKARSREAAKLAS